MSRLYTNAWLVVMDDAGTEYSSGWLLVADGFVRATGEGTPPPSEETIDLGGALVTPGLVNTHHHLFQTLTRARAHEADLGGGVRSGARRNRGARSLGLHDGVRPPLRLPEQA